MKQKIIITALPNGIAERGINRTLKLSAAFGLQVEDANTTLQNVPDMQKWAELVKDAKFIVQLNGSPVEAKVVSKPADAALWKNLFAPAVKVRSFVQEDLAGIPIASYPVKHVLNYIKFVVEATGKNFSKDLPSATDYTENPILHKVSDYQNPQFPQRGSEKISMNELVKLNPASLRIQDLLNSKKVIVFSNDANPEYDFAQLKNFHGWYKKKDLPPFKQPEPPNFEFHSILSSLSAYPQLMRRLGLVVDLEIKIPTGILTGNEDIRVIPSGINFTTATTYVCPATAYTRTADGFYAKALPAGMIDKGHLKINGDGFTVFQVDTDGSAIKLCQQMDGLLLKKAKHIFYAVQGKMPNAAFIPAYNNEAPRKEGLSTNRTAGIAIAKDGRAAQLHENFKRMNDWKTKLVTGAGAPAGVSGAMASWILSTDVLYADDITMGYRMDIQPESGKWFSLHKRNNKFSYLDINNNNIDIPGVETDEGFIQTAASEEATDTGKQLKVGEVIARWEGWSLSVPRPGSSLNDPMTPRKVGEKYQEVYDKSASGNTAKENAKYKTPATVDFKLNVLPSIEKGSLPMLRFGKKYSIKIRTVDIAGNSVAFDSKPENAGVAVKPNIRYMRYEPVDAPFLVLGNEVKDGESSEVLVIRSNEGMTVAQYEAANVDSKHTSPFKAEAVRHVKPPRTTVEMATLHSMLDKGFGPANSTEAAAIYQKITSSKDPLVAETDATYKLKVMDVPDKTINVEYLADPMAAGVTFFISANDPNPKLPNPEILTRRVSFYFDPEVKTAAEANTPANYDKWMNPQTFRIKLKEGNPNIQWIAGERTLEITLQKGVILKLNYASFWRPDELVKYSGILDMMGMNNLGGPVGERIGNGQHWMFSPWREITCVHAVQQPISKIGSQAYPFIAKLQPARDPGENFCKLNSKFLVHGPSTDKLDIEADWTEWYDDGVSIETTNAWNDDVSRTPVKSKVFHFTALYSVFEYVFGDDIPNNPFIIKHQFNDTKHRKINYRSIATTRYRENFFQLIADKKDAFVLTRESNEIKTVIIPSSARPLAPQIEYVIPTFEWDRVTKDKLTVTGRGSGLRIYIKRPWYSSGEGEKLAVVLKKQATEAALLSNPSAINANLYTTWGTDPTKLSATLPGGIVPDQNVFVNVSNNNKKKNVSVEEIPGVRVDIVLYEVKYDKERQLYYVDIMMNFLAAYYPFIRLALARYQEHSVIKDGIDYCLSKIVQADYIQVPPPRGSSIQFGSTKNQVTVAISGTIPNVPSASDFRTRVQFIIEPIEIPASENTQITINAKPIDEYNYLLQQSDINNFGFLHAHVFNLPSEYAGKAYRIKVLEYELIIYDPIKPNLNPGGQNLGGPPMKERLVFADVYEINV